MTMIDTYGSLKEESTTIQSSKADNFQELYRSRRGSSFMVFKTFLTEFRQSTGGSLIVLLGFLTALGVGSLVGVIPQVATQRYAELIYGYGDRDAPCKSFLSGKPMECLQGAEHAQSVASYTALARYLIALLSNSVAGSYADVHGRRGTISTLE